MQNIQVVLKFKTLLYHQHIKHVTNVIAFCIRTSDLWGVKVFALEFLFTFPIVTTVFISVFYVVFFSKKVVFKLKPWKFWKCYTTAADQNVLMEISMEKLNDNLFIKMLNTEHFSDISFPWSKSLVTYVHLHFLNLFW